LAAVLDGTVQKVNSLGVFGCSDAGGEAAKTVWTFLRASIPGIDAG